MSDMYRGWPPGQTSTLSLLGLASKHKVFVSYHHANDQPYRDAFERIFSQQHDVIISASVQRGDIDPTLPPDRIRTIIRDEYLRDSTVTVVLVGTQTWQRKFVDWEISSSIRDTDLNPRSGLLGILLPTFPMIDDTHFNIYTIPPRLYYNQLCGFAHIQKWSNDPSMVSQWIHQAYDRRQRIKPDNSFPSYSYNRTGQGWTP